MMIAQVVVRFKSCYLGSKFNLWYEW